MGGKNEIFESRKKFDKPPPSLSFVCVFFETGKLTNLICRKDMNLCFKIIK